MGFRRLVSDFGMYVLGTGDNTLYLALYVDDLFLFCLYLGRISGVKDQLGHKFKMKDLGEARFLLGLEIRRQPNGDVFLCQEKYSGEVLVKSGMDACNPAAIPLELGQVFTQGSQELPDQVGALLQEGALAAIPYKSAMGSLLYLTSGTRPDLAAAVNTLCRYSQNPTLEHWEGVKRVLRYLKGTQGLGLMYKKGEGLDVWGYSDASHANDAATRKGRSGYVFIRLGQLSAGVALC